MKHLLTRVDVLGIQYMKLQPDRLEAFDRFVAEKLLPAVGNLRPDLRLLYYKPVRGEEAGNYITVFALTKGVSRQVLTKGIGFRRRESRIRCIGDGADGRAEQVPGGRLLCDRQPCRSRVREQGNGRTGS